MGPGRSNKATHRRVVSPRSPPVRYVKNLEQIGRADLLLGSADRRANGLGGRGIVLRNQEEQCGKGCPFVKISLGDEEQLLPREETRADGDGLAGYWWGYREKERETAGGGPVPALLTNKRDRTTAGDERKWHTRPGPLGGGGGDD